VGVVGKRVGIAILRLFFYEIITRTMSENSGSKFGTVILLWNHHPDNERK